MFRGRIPLFELLVPVGIKLQIELIVALLQNIVSLLQRAVLDLNALEHLAGVIVLAQLLTLMHLPIKELIDIRHNLVNNSFGSPISLFHREVFLFKLVQLPLEVKVLLFLHDFPLL